MECPLPRVGAVLIALARGERNICDLSAARALREVVVAVNLKTGNNLVIRPCELYRIGGRIGYILTKAGAGAGGLTVGVVAGSESSAGQNIFKHMEKLRNCL